MTSGSRADWLQSLRSLRNLAACVGRPTQTPNATDAPAKPNVGSACHLESFVAKPLGQTSIRCQFRSKSEQVVPAGAGCSGFDRS